MQSCIIRTNRTNSQARFLLQRARYLKTRAIFVALVTALVLAVPAFSQAGTQITREPLVLSDEQGEYPLGLHMDILEDPGGELTIDEVTSAQYSSQFTPSQEEVPNYGYTDSIFWLRLNLRNETSHTNLWLLESQFPNLNYLDLYLPSEQGGYWVKQSGALRPFGTRDIPYYHVVFEIPLAYQEEQAFYIRVGSGSSMTLGFTLWSPVAFATNKFANMLRIGLFYGALIILLIYQLYAFLLLKEASHFYFVLFLASAILFFATYEGLIDQYLWPGYPEQKHKFMVTYFAIIFGSSLKFTDVFLAQKERAPRLHRLSNYLIGLLGVLLVIALFSAYGALSLAGLAMLLITPTVCVAFGIYHLIKRYRPAWYYLLSWMGFLLGVVLATLVRADVLSSTPLTESFYQFGLVWLAMLWSLGLADRINQLRKETEIANRRLLQIERQQSQILEALPIGVTVYSLDHRPTYANQRAINILANPDKGIQPDVSARRSLSEVMKYYAFRISGSDQTYPLERMPVWKAFEGQSASVDDIEADLVDRKVPLEIWANPVKDSQGQVESVVAAFQDITQRKQAEAELEEYKHKLEQIVQQRTEQLSAANTRLQVENAERQHYEDMLRSRMEWLVVVSQVSQTTSSTSDLTQAYKAFAGVIKNLFGASDAFLADFDPQSGALKLLSHTCQHAVHGDLAEVGFSLPPSTPPSQLFVQGILIILPRDQLTNLEGPLGAHYRHTESRILSLAPLHCQENNFSLLGLEFQEEEKLYSVEETALIEKICLDLGQVRTKARLAEQTREIIATEERSRLARDLHDSVTQMLFSANLVAEVLPQIWHRDPGSALSSLEELRRLTRGALAEMRTLLLELRPSAAVKTPLSDLLTQLTEAVTSRTNLRVHLFVEQIPPLPEDVQLSYYRIAQESLNNVVKHAKARTVAVSLSKTPQASDIIKDPKDEIILIIRDDGCGFDPIDQGAQHLGLAIMRERAAAIHAVLCIDSQVGNGTTVTLTWHDFI
jgi:signal transduction histidine kinase